MPLSYSPSSYSPSTRISPRPPRPAFYYARPDLAWAVLARVLGPLSWRNTKLVVAEEHALPPRSLDLVRLRFLEGEAEFYAQVKEQARQSVRALRAAREEEEAAGGEGAGRRAKKLSKAATLQPTPSPHPAPHASRGAHKSAVVRAEEAVLQGAGQLRLACVHPQLTRHWRTLEADLQLSLGGTLSMEEIMQRLVDRAQWEVQAAERAYCGTLNTLAWALLGEGKRGKEGEDEDGKRGKEGEDEDGKREKDEEGEEKGAARAKKGTRESKSPSKLKPLFPKQQPLSPAPDPARVSEALQALETSYRVSEKGIEAADLAMSALASLPDIAASASATVTAWRLLQLNTGAQLARAYRLQSRAAEAAAMDAYAEHQRTYVRQGSEV
ncbi:hypothetical protein H632_c3478p0, partial [Helicosporidium sp. ATCC 50920]